MLTLLLSALIATAPNTGEISAQADTVNRYNIDRKDIPNFDGSQLVGASIVYYDILVTNENGKVIKNHLITTEKYIKDNNIPPATGITMIRPSNESIIIRETVPGAKDNVIYYVNDKKVDEEKVKEIKPSNIKSITVLKDKAAVEVYGEEARAGVVVITTK
ncbi:MAG: hypothetical protein J6P66_07710 [Bacteroidaceae bacterium]|nr:hypothetical protein [Bacteroidaceae bacterium]